MQNSLFTINFSRFTIIMKSFTKKTILKLTQIYDHITLLRSVFLVVRKMSIPAAFSKLIVDDVLDVGKDLDILTLIKNGKPSNAQAFKELIQAHFDSTCQGIRDQIGFELPMLKYEFGKLGELNTILKSNIAFYRNFTETKNNMIDGREHKEG
ncbi:hypothetical protein MJH12_02955 [bacterium]|nr:hypothetical protein [bacterium]